MTVITSDNRGHNGLWGIFWCFSGFIPMQENVPNQLVFRELFS
jgi:hypothetical protein